MVRAILAGRKTQTRRLASSPLAKALPGDRLYVREAWAIKRHEPCQPHERDWQSLSRPTIRYLADGAEIEAANHGDRTTGRGIYHGPVEKGRPSIHMPRWMSRATLMITDVRFEPVNQISAADAIAEGIYQPNGPGWTHDVDAPDWWNDPVFAFGKLWDSLHDQEGERFAEAPPIVALTFAATLANIDALTP